MKDYKWTSLKEVESKIPEMRKRGISVKARSRGQFIEQFRKAGGNPNKLPIKWRSKRNGFVARHRKSMELHNAKGHNTERQRLALLAWAYK